MSEIKFYYYKYGFLETNKHILLLICDRYNKSEWLCLNTVLQKKKTKQLELSCDQNKNVLKTNKS